MVERAQLEHDVTAIDVSDDAGVAEDQAGVAKRRAWRRWLILAAVFIPVWVGVIPGLAAKYAKVFDDSGVETKADQRWLTQQKSAHKLLITGFRHNNTTAVFLFSYFSLAGIWLFLAPKNTAIRDVSHRCWVFVSGLVAYLPMLAWSVLRNWYPDDPKRTVISYVNLDISRFSFVLQEARILGIFLLLSVIWYKWNTYAKSWRTMWRCDLEYARRCAEPRGSVASASAAVTEHLPGKLIYKEAAADRLVQRFLKRPRTVSHVFLHWQVVSFCIGLALLPWTYEYWLDIVRHGDSRYVNSAATMHAACAMTWFIVTIPLWKAMQVWSRLRERLLIDLSKHVEQNKWLQDVKPVGQVELLTTALVAGLSFFIPVFKAFLG